MFPSKWQVFPSNRSPLHRLQQPAKSILRRKNANEDTRLEDADLFIKSITVNGGKILKRFRPAPQGRAHRIRKRSNHVTLIVDSANAPETEEENAEVNDAKE